GAEGLPQDLLPVRYEEHARVLGAVAVEGAEPGLAEAGREEDQAGGVALAPRFLESSERLQLNRVRNGGWKGLGLHAGFHGGAGRAPLGIRVDPGSVEGAAAWLGPECLERPHHLREARVVASRHHAVVPLHTSLERRLRQVRAADERGASALRL